MSLPSGYKRLEYIQSTGTQYINSLFTASGGKLRFLIDFSYASVTSGQSVFGAQETSGIPYGLIPYTSEAGKAYFYVASSGKIANVSVSADVRNIWDLESYNGILTYTVSGVSKTASYSGTLNKNYPYFIFANNHGGTAKQFCSSKLYSCKIYDNGTLVRDYIPCQTTAGEIGLWDEVNSVFYGNAGTGTFTAGPVMEPPDAPANLHHLLAVRLAWSAVVGATGYNVYRDDVLLTSTTETTFIDLTAAENTEYTYAVSAVGSGGESAKTTLTVYTKSGYFLYKPYIESATFQ